LRLVNFTHGKKYRVEARQLLDNKGSIKVNEKCGFKTEGVLREAVFKNGKYQDLNLMSVLKRDFEELFLKLQGK